MEKQRRQQTGAPKKKSMLQLRKEALLARVVKMRNYQVPHMFSRNLV